MQSHSKAQRVPIEQLQPSQWLPFPLGSSHWPDTWRSLRKRWCGECLRPSSPRIALRRANCRPAGEKFILNVTKLNVTFTFSMLHITFWFILRNKFKHTQIPLALALAFPEILWPLQFSQFVTGILCWLILGCKALVYLLPVVTVK